MVGTSKATWDGNCVSPQSITVCTRLKPFLLPSATTSMVLRNPQNFFVSSVIPYHHQLSAWMASKLSTILDGLQQQVFLLNELIARVATLPPADDSCWQRTVAALLQRHCSYCPHSTATVSYYYRFQPSLMRLPKRYQLVKTSRPPSSTYIHR